MKKIKVDKVKVVKVGKAVILVMYYCGIIVGGYKIGELLALRNVGFGKVCLAAAGYGVVVQAIGTAFVSISKSLVPKVAEWMNKNEVEKELKKKGKKFERNGIEPEVAIWYLKAARRNMKAN